MEQDCTSLKNNSNKPSLYKWKEKFVVNVKLKKHLLCFGFRKETNNYRNECKQCSNKRSKELIKNKFENYEWSDYPKELKCNTCDQIKTINCFPKRKDTELGVRKNCKDCKNFYNHKYYSENEKFLKDYQIIYRKNNREKINTNRKLKRETDPNFKIGCNLRKRVGEVFKTQNVTKRNKTFDLLDCSHSFLQKWISFQLYGDMTLNNYGKVWSLDHCLPVSSFNLLDENEMKKCFNWRNLRPMYTRENIIKGNKIDYWLYVMQEIKSKYFLRNINEQEAID